MDCDLHAWPTKVGKKSNESWQETNYGEQEVERWLGGNTILVGRIPTMVGKKSDNGCHEVQQWLASSPTMVGKVSDNGWQEAHNGGKKSNMGWQDVLQAWQEVQQWLARSTTMDI